MMAIIKMQQQQQQQQHNVTKSPVSYGEVSVTLT